QYTAQRTDPRASLEDFITAVCDRPRRLPPTETGRLDLWGTKKSDVRNVVRKFGFGVPNVRRALASAANSVTLIAEDTIKSKRLTNYTPDDVGIVAGVFRLAQAAGVSSAVWLIG